MPLLISFLGIAANAAATLPVIAILTLLAGRRGNGQFYLYGASRLMLLNFFLALIGPFWFFGAYFMEISHFNAPLSQKLAPLFQLQGLPWSSSISVWFFGIVCLVCAFVSFDRTAKHLPADRYLARQFRRPIIFGLAAAFCFFATFMLINWPFSGLPEGLAWDRAIMAIFRNANRNYFLAFCPAGAIGLTAMLVWQKNLDQQRIMIAARWFSFWAVAGCIPTLLISWGTLMGLGINANASTNMGPQTSGIACLSVALVCWAIILWRPRYWQFLAIFSFFLLLLKTGLPFII